MGFWDDVKEAADNAASYTGSKYYEGIDFGSLPNTYGDIMSKIDDLHPAFVEMYQREKALAAWPDYAFIISLSEDEAQRRSNSNNNSILGNTSTQDLQYPHKPSSVLPFRVPQDAGDGDQQAIDGEARTDAESAITEIRTAFKASLDDGSLASADVLLRQLATTAESIDALIVTHDQAGFKRIRAMFEDWQGSDADAGMEKYGDRLRPAAGVHRQILANLMAGAAAECAAKLTAQVQLGEALDKVHAKIEYLKTGMDPGIKVVTRTAFNEIPHSGSVISFIDGAFEMVGGDDALVSNWVNGFFESLEYEYEMALAPQHGSILRSELLATATSVTETLRAARDDAEGRLGLDFGTWEGWYRSDPQMLIPGEKD
ncbi:hypothetical protein [Glycomyces tarimensis]